MEIVRVDSATYSVDLTRNTDDPERYILNERHRTAIPTTHREFSVLSCGNCPECGATLGGYNDKFCVPDQIWWEFEQGQSFPPASETNKK